MKEIWEDIKDYEGVYKISNFGNIKRIDKHKLGRILSYNKDTTRYPTATLCKNKTRKSVNIHRIVAQTFIPNTENKPCVNHLNGIKTDNRIDNLEWVTYSENIKHSLKVLKQRHNRVGLFGKRNPCSKAVLRFTKSGEYLDSFGGMIDAERCIGINHRRISDCCNGRKKTAGGFVWRLESDYPHVELK